MFELTSFVNSSCISFDIIDDDIIEDTENYSITLMEGRMEVMFVNNSTTIEIIDNDSKTCIDEEYSDTN